MPVARERSRSTEITRPIERSIEEPARRRASLLSPAARVLYLSAGNAGTDQEIVRLIAAGIDWTELLALATLERAVPIVWRRVQDVDPNAVPAHVAEPMARLAMVTDFKSLHLEQRLGDVLALLAEAGIAPTLLKGAALAHAVYHSFTHRPMLDLDLLVAPERAVEAHALLRGAGWSLAPGTEMIEDFYAHHHHLAPLVDARGSGALLELHTSLFSPGHSFRLSPAWIRGRSERVTVNGRDAIVPGPRDLLLHACIHFAWSHMMGKGAWRAFHDVAALAESGRLDWDAFVADAAEIRGATCCYWALRLSQDLAGVRIPPAVLAALRPPLPVYLTDRLQVHFVTQLAAGGTACPSVSLEHRLWELAILPARNGLGAERPWHQSREFSAASAPMTQRPTRLRRMASHLGDLGRWTRYCRALLREQPAV